MMLGRTVTKPMVLCISVVQERTERHVKVYLEGSQFVIGGPVIKNTDGGPNGGYSSLSLPLLVSA